MNRRHSVVMACALLALASPAVWGRQGAGPPPPPADLAQRIRASQDRMFKQDYGFTDKQIAEYRKKDTAIKASYEKKMEALRKQVSKSPPPKKRELYTKIRALEKQMDKDRNKSLLSIANPSQQARIKAKYAEQGIPL